MNNLEKNINILKLDKNIENKLNKLEIFTINDLWNINRNYLKNNNFKDYEIKEIRIKLQLISLDLNKKVYK